VRYVERHRLSATLPAWLDRSAEVPGVTMTASESDHRHAGEARSIRVLLVDDHATFRQMLADFLSGHDDIDVVGECEDGSTCVEAAARLRPDVVLMDLSMPGVDGEEATRLLRAAEPDVRVVILTAEGAAARQRAADAGAHALVPKDADPDALVACLRSVSAPGGCSPYCL
jgi:DNA-binding NarL/FixJ family response regulator